MSLVGFSACGKGRTSSGKLECLDGWPPGPEAEAAAPSLQVRPAVLWQSGFASFGALPKFPGVALSGDSVIAAGDASWVALDRLTGGTKVTHHTDPSNYFLGSPAVDRQGDVYVQSNSTIYGFSPDGTTRWAQYLPGQAPSAEPVKGIFAPAIVADALVIAGSYSGVHAFDLAGVPVWTQPTVALQATVGHWGLGGDGTVSDLRTGLPSGRLQVSTGDVAFLAPLYRGLFVRHANDGGGFHVALLDTCGVTKWSTDILPASSCGVTGSAVVGLGDVVYFLTECDGNSPPPAIVGVGPDGHVFAGPTPSTQVPWLVGADGTIYATELPGTGATSTLVALSATLQELWRVSLSGSFDYLTQATISDDGVLYAPMRSGDGNVVVAVQTTSPGLAPSSWPTRSHDGRASVWGGGQF